MMNARTDASAKQFAYSLLEIKEVDEQRRTLAGIASTPTPDRMRDIVMPMGARFKTPMPLLLYHDSRQPVGSVDFAKPNKSGIPFNASIPIVQESGRVKDRVDEAWHSLKYQLLGAVSIGFVPTEEKGSYEFLDNGGIQYNSWDWLELSLVTIPAQPDAVITSFKSMDSAAIRRSLNLNLRTAASGIVRLRNLPGASGQTGVVRLRKPNHEESQGEHQRPDHGVSQ